MFTTSLGSIDDEFTDRFGSLPEPVENLLFQMKIKVLAVTAKLSSVSIESGQLILRYPKGTTPPTNTKLPPEIRAGKTAFWVKLPPEDEDWTQFLVDILTKLNPSSI